MEAGQIFEEGVALPKAAPYACATGLNVGNNLGMLSCTITAKTNVSIAAGKKATVTFQHAESQDGPYTDCSTHTVSLAAALSVGAGGVVARIVLPLDSKPWIKAVVSCDDTAASGSINVFVEYLAR